MSLREFSAVVTTVLLTIGTVWYIVVVLRGNKVRPALASWIVFGGTLTLSFATYWTSPNHSLVSNACNAASVLSAVSILVVVVWIYVKRGEQLRFSTFQKWCLVTSGLIAVLWATLVWGFRGTGIVPNILTQVLMIVGYLVTVEKLWQATKNTESFVFWGCLFLGSAVALYTGVVSSDNLAVLYAVRATIASATIVWLMYRIERKQVVR